MLMAGAWGRVLVLGTTVNLQRGFENYVVCVQE